MNRNAFKALSAAVALTASTTLTSHAQSVVLADFENDNNPWEFVEGPAGQFVGNADGDTGFTFGTWRAARFDATGAIPHNITVQSGFASIGNPTNGDTDATRSGGSGVDFRATDAAGRGGTEGVIDLVSRFGMSTVGISIDVRLRAGNQTDSFTFSLLDDLAANAADPNFNAGRAEFVFNAANNSNFGNLNETTFTTLRWDGDLATVQTADGARNFNPSNIEGWRFQGDFSNTDALSIDIDNVIIPEPGTAGLLLIGLLPLAFLRRRIA